MIVTLQVWKRGVRLEGKEGRIGYDVGFCVAQQVQEECSEEITCKC